LKRELGFGGYILSDWDGTHSGVMSVNNGLDMTMPGDIGMDGGKTTYFGQHLLDAVKNGSVSVDRFDDMAQRIIAGWFLLDQDKNFPDVNFESWRPDGPNNSHVDVRDDHDELIRTVGAASVVMLKNTDNALPLCKPKTIAIIGSDMGPSTKGPNGYADRAGDEGTLAIGWGSGTSNFPYLVTPLEAISLQARKDHSVVNWWLRDWDLSGAASVAMNAEVCLVGINSDSGEEYLSVDGNVGDRNNLTAWNNGDNLVKAVAAKCNNTIVIVHSVGPMLVEEWIDHPNVTGVLWAGLPGQESGTSLVDVLYGAWNPSGRLPYTIARNRTDYSADITYVPTNSPRNNVYYNEGLDIDYKHFLRHGIEPRFPFGFGMSYTTFEYSAIGIEWITQPDGRSNDSEEEEDPEFGRSVRKE
jgi:beta-glucosidase